MWARLKCIILMAFFFYSPRSVGATVLWLRFCRRPLRSNLQTKLTTVLKEKRGSGESYGSINHFTFSIILHFVGLVFTVVNLELANTASHLSM